MKDHIRLEAPVKLWSVDQLEEAYLHSDFESVFAWLRKLTESDQLLVVKESFWCREARP